MRVESTDRSGDRQPSKLRVAGSIPAAPTIESTTCEEKTGPASDRASAFEGLKGSECWANVGRKPARFRLSGHRLGGDRFWWWLGDLTQPGYLHVYHSWADAIDHVRREYARGGAR